MAEDRQVVFNDPRKEDRMYLEAIKNLRTNLQFAGVNIKNILVTSCFPNEGKSDITMQLVRELGNINKKVILVDADIRKSTFVSRYQIDKPIKGLSHYLSGLAQEEEIIYTTNYKNMDMIFAGALAPNPSELLEEELMAKLLSDLREKYDYVIIDTSPVSTMSDALIIAKWCDGALLVIESGKVSYRVVQRAKEQILKTGCKILGAILNKVNIKNDRYYGYYEKNGYYKNDDNNGEN